MKGGREPQPPTTLEDETTARPSEESEVVEELRPVENLRVCPTCLVANSARDSFCTACGTSLGAAEEKPDETNALSEERDDRVSEWPTASHPLPPLPREGLMEASDPPTAVARTIAHRRWLLIAASLIAVCGLVVASAFAVLWRSESRHATRVEARLDTTQGRLRAVQATLAVTEAKLASATSLAARRRTLLLRAQDVLRKVDPLLSDADNLKQITGQIQTARDTFANDSAQMTSDLLLLENYEANPQNYPGVDQWSLVDQVDAELAMVRSDYATLTSSDGNFSTASTTFGGHADAFTKAVRDLQKQLKNATGP